MSGLSVSIAPQNPEPAPAVASTTTRAVYGTRTVRFAAVRACDNPSTMPLDDRFDDLIASLGGFHRSWLIYLGIELGLFAHVREAGAAGLTTDELAARAACHPAAIEAWAWAADAHDLVTLEDGRLTDGRRRRRDPPRRRPSRVPRRPVRPRRGRLPGLGRDGRFLPDRRTDPRAAGPLPRRDRAADRAGHRGLLPGGAGGAPAAGGGPGARRAGRGRPLRRRRLAHRDGSPVRRPGAGRRGVRGRLGRPCPGQGRRGRADRTGSPSGTRA